ncbi:hypothetical protein ACQ858_07000 [Variovorax ureilyticus]|uniref:hypothetical protein n=1 Tax=Variovorax ureilyticus TaxID=1836198 RepID=UPI003D6791E0
MNKNLHRIIFNAEAEQKIGELMNKINVLVATPFAFSSLLPPELLNSINLLLRK